jgi:hypothetical protein
MGNIEPLHRSSNGLENTFLGRLNNRVMTAVCVAMHENDRAMSPALLMSRTRQADIVFARSTCMLILWGSYGHGVTSIGNTYGMNHASVIHARTSSVNRIEQEGWCGRVYITACHLLNIETLEYIHPVLVDKRSEPKHTNNVVKVRRMQRANSLKERPRETSTSPSVWSAEQLARRKLANDFPGHVPRRLILAFERRFGVQL